MSSCPCQYSSSLYNPVLSLSLSQLTSTISYSLTLCPFILLGDHSLVSTASILLLYIHVRYRQKNTSLMNVTYLVKFTICSIYQVFMIYALEYYQVMMFVMLNTYRILGTYLRQCTIYKHVYCTEYCFSCFCVLKFGTFHI